MRYPLDQRWTSPKRELDIMDCDLNFVSGQNVDPSGELPDGRALPHDVRELKQELLTDEEQLARNLARQLTIYAETRALPSGFQTVRKSQRCSRKAEIRAMVSGHSFIRWCKVICF